jgi:ribosomal protein L7/L12
MEPQPLVLGAILGVLILSLLVRRNSEPAGLRAIDRKLNLILEQLGIDPDKGLDAQLKELVQSGQKIEAIRLYRQQTGCGLKEAKDHIEATY